MLDVKSMVLWVSYIYILYFVHVILSVFKHLFIRRDTNSCHFWIEMCKRNTERTVH